MKIYLIINCNEFCINQRDTTFYISKSENAKNESDNIFFKLQKIYFFKDRVTIVIKDNDMKRIN